jgi:hypothetical protein
MDHRATAGASAAAEQVGASFRPRATAHIRRDQTRGGRKGGLPACEGSELLANANTRFTPINGNRTSEKPVPAKLKHFNAHTAIDVQSPMAFSHGAGSGQQSCIGSDADNSAALTLTAAPPAAGSIATDAATTKANMVRPTFIFQRPALSELPPAGSSDDCAS